MIFNNATVKSVKADLAKGEITVTITMSINDERMKEASILAATYTGEDASDVEVHIVPRQMRLFDSLPPMLDNVDSVTPETVEPTEDEQSTGEEEDEMESEEEGVIEIDYETDTQSESEDEATDEPIP